MPEVQEVFRMATQKVRPDPGALDRQQRNQRWRVAKKKTAVYALVAAVVVTGMVIGTSALRSGDGRPVGGPGFTPSQVTTPTPTPLRFSGALEAGTYILSAIDPDFDASHRITMSVPEGYTAFEGWGIMKDGGRQWVSASIVGSVYADPCHWNGTLLDPPVGANFDALVSAIASMPGLHASSPADVTVAGFAGKRIDLTVPTEFNLADCDNGQIRNWLDTGGGERNIPFTGERDRLWILDVGGVPLVIEAGWPTEASAQVRAELVQMVESVNID